MGRFDTTKSMINANVKTNGKQEITGQVMNNVLTQMVEDTDSQLTDLESEIGNIIRIEKSNTYDPFIIEQTIPATKGCYIKVDANGSVGTHYFAYVKYEGEDKYVAYNNYQQLAYGTLHHLVFTHNVVGIRYYSINAIYNITITFTIKTNLVYNTLVNADAINELIAESNEGKDVLRAMNAELFGAELKRSVEKGKGWTPDTNIYNISIPKGATIELIPHFNGVVSKITGLYLMFDDGSQSAIYSFATTTSVVLDKNLVAIKYYCEATEILDNGIISAIVISSQSAKAVEERANKRIDESNERINGLLSRVVGSKSDATIQQGYIMYSDGSFKSNPNMQTFEFANHSYKKIKVNKLYFSDNVPAAIAFYNTTTITTEGYLADSSIQARVNIEDGENYLLDIPNECKLICVVNRSALGDDFSVELFSDFQKDIVEIFGNDNQAYNIAIAPNLIYVAHRGVHINGIAPDNSIDSVMLAARAGFDYVEVDLRKTKDDHFIVMHGSLYENVRNKSDYSLVAFGTYPEDYTLEELRNLFVLASDNPQMRKPIPTFEEVLKACKKFGIKPYIHNITGLLGSSGKEHWSDPQKIVDMIRTICGTDDFFFGGILFNEVRKLSKGCNCGNVGEAFPLYNEDSADTYVSTYGDGDGAKAHTNYNAYAADQTNFNIDNLAFLKKKLVKIGVFETGAAVQPNLNLLLNKGIDMVVTDFTCPSSKDKKAYALFKTDGGFSDFDTNGNIIDGRLLLEVGQYIKLPSIISAPYFGGVAFNMQFNGSGTLKLGGYTASGKGKSALNVVSDNINTPIVYNYLLHNENPSFEFLATSRCEISNVYIGVVNL